MATPVIQRMTTPTVGKATGAKVATEAMEAETSTLALSPTMELASLPLIRFRAPSPIQAVTEIRAETEK